MTPVKGPYNPDSASISAKPWPMVWPEASRISTASEFSKPFPPARNRQGADDLTIGYWLGDEDFLLSRGRSRGGVVVWVSGDGLRDDQTLAHIDQVRAVEVIAQGDIPPGELVLGRDGEQGLALGHHMNDGPRCNLGDQQALSDIDRVGIGQLVDLGQVPPRLRRTSGQSSEACAPSG